MKINILCIGKIKESYYNQACAEYAKRLKRFCQITVTELPERSVVKNPSEKQIEAALNSEYADCSKHIKGALIALDKNGEKLSSRGLADYISGLKTQGISEVTFLIGSSYGLSELAKQNAYKIISFSDLTFAHGLFRVMLLEQLYRCFMIENNMTYHK